MPLALHRCYVLACATFVASCTTKSIEHGTPGGSGFATASATAGGGVGESGPVGHEDGNFPEPATTRCGDVMGDLPAIDGLKSAWAVIAVPDATQNGQDVPAGSMFVRLSEDVISDCGGLPFDNTFRGSGGGSSSTGFVTGGIEFSTTGSRFEEGTGSGLELMLAPNEAAVGTYPFEALASDVAIYGEDAPAEMPVEATIELLHVDDDCVIGTIRGLTGESGSAFMEGGFVAQTCQRQCIPYNQQPC